MTAKIKNRIIPCPDIKPELIITCIPVTEIFYFFAVRCRIIPRCPDSGPGQFKIIIIKLRIIWRIYNSTVTPLVLVPCIRIHTATINICFIKHFCLCSDETSIQSHLWISGISLIPFPIVTIKGCCKIFCCICFCPRYQNHNKNSQHCQQRQQLFCVFLYFFHFFSFPTLKMPKQLIGLYSWKNYNIVNSQCPPDIVRFIVYSNISHKKQQIILALPTRSRFGFSCRTALNFYWVLKKWI